MGMPHVRSHGAAGTASVSALRRADRAERSAGPTMQSVGRAKHQAPARPLSPGLVAEITASIPADLKELRGKLMLECLCDALGVEERPCPACGGTGWLGAVGGRACPLCLGFLAMPTRLADWFTSLVFAAGAQTG